MNLTVLQVIPELDAGGAERTAVDIAAAIREQGGTALVASAGGRLQAELARAGAEHIRLPLASKNPLVIWANAGRLARIIRERNVSVIHARSRAPAWSALIAARRTKIPFVTTYHGAYKAAHWLKKKYNSVMAAGDAVIANSGFTAAAIRSAYRIDEARIAVIPRGTDLAAFDRATVTLERVLKVKHSWNLAGFRGPIILLPGRLTRWKGQLVFIEALARLKAEGRLSDIAAVLAGDAQGRDDYVMDVMVAIESAGLKPRVRVVGHVEDMPSAYAASTLVVSASTEPEAFGRVIVEASAMGLPVIATDHGGARETVVAVPASGATGWLVPPGDAGALANAIAKAIRDPREAQAMGARGAAFVRTRFSREAMCRATLEVYSRLAAPPAITAP